MNEQFFEGDLVQLRSGGPLMTVDQVRPRVNDRGGVDLVMIHCRWFSADGQLQLASFRQDTLQPAPRNPIEPKDAP